MYSFFNLDARWGGWSKPRSSHFTPGKETGYPCTGGWVGPRAGLDGGEKSRPHRYSIPGKSSPQRVSIPSKTSPPAYCNADFRMNGLTGEMGGPIMPIVRYFQINSQDRYFYIFPLRSKISVPTDFVRYFGNPYIRDPLIRRPTLLLIDV
jgi:hypothetical protein